MISCFLDWLLGEKCISGTRGCWGRCVACMTKRIAQQELDRNGGARYEITEPEN